MKDNLEGKAYPVTPSSNGYEVSGAKVHMVRSIWPDCLPGSIAPVKMQSKVQLYIHFDRVKIG